MHLVICVDRDDDLGRKARVAGPVIGRAAVLDAATRLGVADPEDSDANAMLAAVGLFDELRAAGDEAEVAVLSGDARVGIISDREIARQFDEVLKKLEVSSLYLVSDGAEDENVFPILSSRKPIASVKRIYIRQTATLQGTYYTVVRALKDRKLRFKTILPAAAFLLFLGFVESLSVFYGLDIWSYGAVFLLLFIGAYLVIWTFDIDEWMLEKVQTFGSDLRSGSIAVFMGVISVTFFVLGWVNGDASLANPGYITPGAHIYEFLYAAIVWWVAAAAVWEGGSAVHQAMSGKGFPQSFWVVSVSITAFGVESYALLSLAQTTSSGLSSFTGLVPDVVGVALGIAMGAFAGVLRQYLQVRSRVTAEMAAAS
jgi:putative membrane protein